MRAGDDVGDDFGGDGVGNRRLEDADDGGGCALPRSSRAGQSCRSRWDRSAANLRPELIGEDDGAGGVGAVVGGAEQAAEDGAQAHDFEVVAVDDAGGDFARRAQARRR